MKKKKTPSKASLALSLSEKQSIQAELGLSSTDLQEKQPTWAYASGGLMVLMALGLSAYLVRSA